MSNKEIALDDLLRDLQSLRNFKPMLYSVTLKLLEKSLLIREMGNGLFQPEFYRLAGLLKKNHPDEFEAAKTFVVYFNSLFQKVVLPLKKLTDEQVTNFKEWLQNEIALSEMEDTVEKGR